MEVAQRLSPNAWREFTSATTAEAFYHGWLAVQCRVIADVAGGVVFGVSPARELAAPIATCGENPGVLRALTVAARQALSQRRRVVVKRVGETGQRWSVAFPVPGKGQMVGVVALDLGPRAEPALRGALRQLEWGSGWVEALALRQSGAGERRDLRDDAAARARLETVLDLAASAQGHERFSDAAVAFVTEVATRLDCDRVSIGFLRGGRARVRAMSHTADLGGRTNLLRAIEARMDEAIDGKVAVARDDAGGAVCTVPIASGSRIVGALTLERPAGRPFEPGTRALAEAVAGLVGPGLETLRREDRWLAAKVMDSGARTLAGLFGPGHLALKLGALGAVVTAGVLAFATGNYRVSARAVMEAGVQRAAVAPFGGYLREAPVRAGDLVRAGQVLAVLDDRELRLERTRLESQRDQLERQRALALAQGNAAQINIARAQIEQTDARLALADDQLGKTRIVAAFDGVIVTGDLGDSLGAPVERGQVLFEIAPLDAYRLVVQVDERDVNDVAVGQRGQLRLASAPFDPVPFAVAKLVPVATAKDGRNFFRVEARLDAPARSVRPGMEGVAKIDVDRRRLAAIWLRAALDWARLTLWTWWP